MREPRGWQDEILEKIPSGVDGSQIEACLQLSPTDRLERMRRFLVGLELARTNDARLPKTR
ncbi:MAG TPA: hypothetical protein VFU21_24470 [Kofleriaceae bacterium]|nr:hypothetical protein [Kofleriaceae bacterium]